MAGCFVDGKAVGFHEYPFPLVGVIAQTGRAVKDIAAKGGGNAILDRPPRFVHLAIKGKRIIVLWASGIPFYPLAIHNELDYT